MNPTLLVLAAGIGSRYGGLKQIDSIGPHGETILDYSLFDATRAGFDRVVFVIRRDIESDFREAIGKRFESITDVAYSFQELDRVPAGFTVSPTRKKPWGTGHAVLVGEDVVSSSFGVINADDFYGADSYRVLAEFLRNARDDRRAHYAMVGFRLRNTLSEHGHVSRGICDCDDASFLRGITEYTRIFKRGEAAAHEEEDGASRAFTGDECVSMNMWGFTPSIFGHLQRQFGAFLESRGQEDKSEFYLPAVVDALTAEGQADVRVLTTTANWFGVTYREDKPVVENHIRRLIQEGHYPERLVSD